MHAKTAIINGNKKATFEEKIEETPMDCIKEEIINNNDTDDSQHSNVNSSVPINMTEIVKTEGVLKPKFQPKVPPTEYQRFIYKCHDCMLGFKRRGMCMPYQAKTTFIFIRSINNFLSHFQVC